MSAADREAIVGVIGGMGPEATIELMQRVLAATAAGDDGDHIHMIVDNNPKVPSRIAALLEGRGDDPGPVIADMAKRLETAGADFLVMPCNTAHHYWPVASRAVSIPVWHLVDLTLEAVTRLTGSDARIGVLGSPAIRRIRLYETRARRYGIAVQYPADEAAQLRVIRAVKAGGASAADVNVLNEAMATLAAGGADAVVLACTEFSLLANRLSSTLPVVDSLQVLAERIVDQVKRPEREGSGTTAPVPGR